MKISEALNLAGGNFARPAKFTAIVIPPIALQDTSFDVMCKTVQVPETVMETIPLMFKGHTLNIPGRVNQSKDLVITFYLDEFHMLRQIFYDWIAGIDKRFYGAKSDRSREIYDNLFEGQLVLITRDFAETLNEPMNYVFEGLYPINVQGVEFNTAGTNEVMEFTVTFDFYKFRHISAISDIHEDLDVVIDSHFEGL